LDHDISAKDMYQMSDTEFEITLNAILDSPSNRESVARPVVHASSKPPVSTPSRAFTTPRPLLAAIRDHLPSLGPKSPPAHRVGHVDSPDRFFVGRERRAREKRDEAADRRIAELQRIQREIADPSAFFEALTARAARAESHSWPDPFVLLAGAAGARDGDGDTGATPGRADCDATVFA
jgi:hypothetical protein